MSADNNHFMNREIQALQQEEPRPDAKAELILALLKEKRENKMSVLRKVSVPTLVSIAAIAGVFYVAQPKVVAATPERVIKAIQDIKTYTIKSFTIDGKERHLQSKTTVNGKDRNTVYYDTNGKETAAPNNGAVLMMNKSPMHMGFKVDDHGDLKTMSRKDIDDMKATMRIQLDGNSVGNGDKVKVEVKKGPDGKEEKHIFVNGKEVDKLPDHLSGKVHIMGGSDLGNVVSDGKEVRIMAKTTPDGKQQQHIYVDGKQVNKLPEGIKLDGKQTFKVELKKGPNGKEEKHYFVNGKEVDKLPEGMKMPKFHVKKDGKDGATIFLNGAEVKAGKNGVTSVNKSIAMVGGSKDGKPMLVQSGQTSADYLVNLLKDTTKWTIERGVTYNGQKYDKFMLKGPISPIILYVDPATALPKVLRFETPMHEGTVIEDIYEYSIQP